MSAASEIRHSPSICARPYGHWTQEVRRSKIGLLLRPDIDFDGDLVGATLPRRAPVQMTVGRGYLAHNGELDIAQVAMPSMG